MTIILEDREVRRLIGKTALDLIEDVCSETTYTHVHSFAYKGSLTGEDEFTGKQGGDFPYYLRQLKEQVLQHQTTNQGSKY